METFQFGKYKGKRVDDICQSDPKYCLWANESMGAFELTQEQYAAAKYRLYEQELAYLEWSENFKDGER